MSDNQKVIDFFSNLERVFKGKASNMDSSGIRLSDTDEGARMISRIDAMKSGKMFDESSTPPEELEDLQTKIKDFIVKQEIEDILGK
jgi:hypothetical protein